MDQTSYQISEFGVNENVNSDHNRPHPHLVFLYAPSGALTPVLYIYTTGATLYFSIWRRKMRLLLDCLKRLLKIGIRVCQKPPGFYEGSGIERSL